MTRRKFIKQGALWVPTLVGLTQKSRAVQFPFSFWKTDSAPSSTEWMTAVSGGTPRSDYSEPLGCCFDVGGSPITVTHLGRWIISGNNQIHTVSLGTGTTGFPLSVLGSVSVDTTLGTPGTFLYTALGSPVTLSASTRYVIVSSETAFLDSWLNAFSFTFATNAAAPLSGSVFTGGGNLVVSAGDGASYIPCSFKF